MKSLQKYLNESIRVEKTGHNYDNLIILERRDLNCSELTEDEFVKIMEKDLKEAKREYSKLGDNANDQWWNFQAHPGDGISWNLCDWSFDMDKNKIKKAYDALSRDTRSNENLKWWNQAIGWIIYAHSDAKGSKKVGNSSTNVRMRLCFPPDIERQWIKEDDDYTADVMGYYASKKPGEYVGD